MAIFSRPSSSVEIKLKVEEGAGRPIRNLDKQNEKGFVIVVSNYAKEKT